MQLAQLENTKVLGNEGSIMLIPAEIRCVDKSASASISAAIRWDEGSV